MAKTAVAQKPTGIKNAAAVPQVAAIKGMTPLGLKTKKAVEVKHPTPEELASSPLAVPTKKPAKAKKEVDEYGFGVTSQAAWMMKAIASGKYTKAEMEAAFVAHFTKEGPGRDADPGEAGAARKKISFSVFWSDVTKPFAMNHASRSLIINTDPKTKKVSFDAKRLDLVRDRLGAGLMKELKALNWKMHSGRITKVLKAHGLPTEVEKTK